MPGDADKSRSESASARKPAADLRSPEVQIAWARIVARAAVDEAFRRRLVTDPRAVFEEFGVKLDRAVDLNKDFSPPLDEVLADIERQKAQFAANAAAAVGVGVLGSGSSPGAAQPGAGLSGNAMATLDCFGTFSTAGCPIGTIGTQACLGTISGKETDAMSNMAGMGSTQLGASLSGRMDMGRSFSCWGSAGTIGSWGTFGGSAGTVGTGACFGSAGGKDVMTGNFNAVSGGSMSSFGTFGNTAASAGSSALDQQGRSFGCSGCFGTAGSLGTVGGCAGTANFFYFLTDRLGPPP